MKDIIINGKIYNNISKLNFKNDLGEIVTFIEESEIKPTDLNLFTFSGETLTGYVGKEPNIILPKSYSLGPMQSINMSFDSFNSFQNYYYDNDSNFSYPLIITDANNNKFSVNGVWEVDYLPLMYPISVPITKQTYVEGNDYIITEIKNSAFYGNNIIKSVVISEGIQILGGGAFHSCYYLESVTIPSSLISIGTNAFNSCRSLKNIKVSSSNLIFDSRDNCNAIIETATNTIRVGSINTLIPDTVTSIGDYSFDGGGNIGSIAIPDSVTIIGKGAFRGCNLYQVILGKNVSSIGDSAFYNCYNLIEVINKSPHIYLTIGSRATGYVSAYAKQIISNIDQSKITKDSDGFIYYNNTILIGYDINRKSFNLPYGITEINKGCFADDLKLESIYIPESVTHIGYEAFNGCRNLIDISIPDSIKYVDNSAFFYINDSAYYIENNSYYLGNANNKYVLLYKVANAEDNYTINTNTKVIGSSCFDSNETLQTINIPKNIVSMSYGSFGYCKNLSNVTFESPLNWIVTAPDYGYSASVETISLPELSNSATNATYLKSTYRYYTWSRS